MSTIDGNGRSLRRWAILVVYGAALLWFLIAPMSTPIEWSRQIHCAGHLREIGLALLSYYDHNGCFPPAYIADEEGTPLHSWRVLLLPYLGEDELYERYNFDEPWNGPNNRLLLQDRPNVYVCPTQHISGIVDPDSTCFLAIVGSHTAWRGSKCTTPGDFFDGTSAVVMAVEESGTGIKWTEPRDLTYDGFVRVSTNQSPYEGVHPPDNLIYRTPKSRNVLFADGRVMTFANDVGNQLWEKLLNVSDGDDIDLPALGIAPKSQSQLKIGNLIWCIAGIILALCPLFVMCYRWIISRVKQSSRVSVL